MDTAPRFCKAEGMRPSTADISGRESRPVQEQDRVFGLQICSMHVLLQVFQMEYTIRTFLSSTPKTGVTGFFITDGL
jgi:hypothetical protein